MSRRSPPHSPPQEQSQPSYDNIALLIAAAEARRGEASPIIMCIVCVLPIVIIAIFFIISNFVKHLPHR
jgi:hypothetical protein